MRGNIAVVALIIFFMAGPAPAAAQDMPGIEACTKESAPDRRTGCLQSNIEYLVRIVSRHNLDAEQKFATIGREVAALREQLAASSREIAAMKEQLVADRAEVAALKGALAAAHTRLDQLKK